MRAAALVALVVAVPTAAADPRSPGVETFKPGVVFRGPGHATGSTKAFTDVSHVIYLNNCEPGGCAVRPGFDDSLTHHSSIAAGNRMLPAWKWGDAKWQALVQCVKDTYAPFDISIVTTDP